MGVWAIARKEMVEPLRKKPSVERHHASVVVPDLPETLSEAGRNASVDRSEDGFTRSFMALENLLQTGEVGITLINTAHCVVAGGCNAV
mmetsp:Transcript_10701/g.20110  ORF Transcript_10701/g.20110 Transcript_10701/m.20110 type:complete len:89 (+) Transcript_10701:421-687(+)